MATDNRISASIPADDKTAILAAIQTIRQKLPFLVNLTTAQRRELPKMKDKTVAFDQKCAGYMAAHPELVPGFVDTAELGKDRALVTDLNDIERELSQLAQAVDDTVVLAGSEAYMADLAFYQNVRQAAQRDVAGTRAVYQDLSERFPGRPSKVPVPAPA